MATENSIDLTWTAPGDDGNVGQAAGYLCRYSTSAAISSETAWDNATPFLNTPTPKPAGQTENLTVTDLTMLTQYWFNVRAVDESGNLGALSNSPTATTVAPTETILIEQPDSGTNYYFGGYSSGQYWQAQSFTLTGEAALTAASIFLWNKTGSPTGNHTFRIETDSGGVPSGTLVHTNATSTSAPSLQTWNKKSFAAFIISAGTYWLVASCDTQIDSNYWWWHGDFTEAYSGGTNARSTDGGSTWATVTRDIKFRIWGAYT